MEFPRSKISSAQRAEPLKYMCYEGGTGVTTASAHISSTFRKNAQRQVKYSELHRKQQRQYVSLCSRTMRERFLEGMYDFTVRERRGELLRAMRPLDERQVERKKDIRRLNK